MTASMATAPRRVVGARIVLESERAARPPRGGVIEEIVHAALPSYRVLWDDGHTSILTPASGCARIAYIVGDAADEAVFRSINDRIRKLEQPWVGTYDFVCECEDAACTNVMRLSEREYDNLRAVAGQFAVVPGHEQVQGARVVARTDRYVVVKRQLR